MDERDAAAAEARIDAIEARLLEVVPSNEAEAEQRDGLLARVEKLAGRLAAFEPAADRDEPAANTGSKRPSS